MLNINRKIKHDPPQESFAVEWSIQDGGYCFRLADDVLPEKKTSKTKPSPLQNQFWKMMKWKWLHSRRYSKNKQP